MLRLTIPVTTAADGSATAYSPRRSGKVHSVHYLKTDFADGVDFVITAEATGESIWSQNDVNAATVRYPRAATHTQAGAAALYASGGTPVQDKIALGNDRVKVVVAAGGNVKTGTIVVLLDE